MQTYELDELTKKVTERVWELLSNRSYTAFELSHLAYTPAILEQLKKYSQLVFSASKQDMTTADLLCLSVLSQQQILAVANLQEIDLISSICVSRLLAGQPVLICRNVTIYPHLAYGVRQKLQQAQKQLTKYGVMFADDPFLPHLLKNKFGKPEKLNVKPEFITADHLMDYVVNGQLILSNNSVLTPLAREFAHEQQLIKSRDSKW